MLKTVYSTGETWEFGESGLVYKNGRGGQPQPYQISTPEGRAIYQNGTWQNEFAYTDHLGNTRVSFRANGNQLEKVAETAFDPWGVVLNGVGQENSFENRFKHQGKESMTLFGLSGINDFGARYLDKTTGGRWWGVDPLADEQENWSPYHYNYGNPVNYVDLYGLNPISICPTCPLDSKYDAYRDSKYEFTYDKGTGIVLNGNGQGATVYGKSDSYDNNNFSGFLYGFGRSMNYLGGNNVSTRGKFEGATQGTSLASEYLSRTNWGQKNTPKWLFEKLPKRIGIKGYRKPISIRSPIIGRVVGRTIEFFSTYFLVFVQF